MRYRESDVSLRPHLREIARAAQQAVGNARRAPAAAGDLERAIVVHGDFQNVCRAANNGDQIFRRIKFQPVHDAETRAQRRGYQARASGGADQSEAIQDERVNSCTRALSDHQIDAIVFHRGVQDFFDCGHEAMNFIEEENFALFEGREDRGQVALAFEQRARNWS